MPLFSFDLFQGQCEVIGKTSWKNGQLHKNATKAVQSGKQTEISQLSKTRRFADWVLDLPSFLALLLLFEVIVFNNDNSGTII